MYTDLAFDIFILILVIHFGKSASCGIPIFMWNLIYFIILGVKTVAHLFKIVIVRSWPRHLNRYSIATFLMADGTFIGWLIYGNILFYSKANNCGLLQNSQVLYHMMMVLLIIGYFQMLVYFLLICCLPCLIVALRR